MKQIQKISIMTVFTLFFSVMAFLSSAFADTGSTTGTGNSTSTSGTSTVTASTYDGNLGQIDDLYNQLLSLRQQEKDLDVQLKTQHDQNTAAIKALYAQISQDDLAKIKAVHDQNKSLRDTNKALFDQWNNLSLQLKNARAMKDEKLTVELRLQINELKKQLQPIWDQTKANDASIKDVVARVNAARKKIHAVLDPLKPTEQQIRTLWSTVQSLETQRRAGWEAFNTAINSGDMNGAIQALSQIVTAKQQILDTTKQIYSLQQQIGIALGANSTASTTTPASN